MGVGGYVARGPGDACLLGHKRGRGERGGVGFRTPVLCESSGVRAKREGAYLSRLDLPPFARRGGMAPTPRAEGGESRPARVEQGGTKRGRAQAVRHQG